MVASLNLGIAHSNTIKQKDKSDVPQLSGFLLHVRGEAAFCPQPFGSGNTEYIPPSSLGE